MLQRPTTELLSAITSLWDLEDQLTYLQFSESFVYEGVYSNTAVICRVMPANHRTFDEVVSELDWSRYLSEAGLSVAKPIASKNGNLVENFEMGGSFHVSLFEKAKGKSLESPAEFTLPIFKEWGQFLGKMHRLTKTYRPTPPIKPRLYWQDSPTIKLGRLGLDPKDKVPHDRFLEFHRWLQTLETDDDCFGLIHADLHARNFFVNEGQITAFDFDDSCYHWFCYDLAVPLFSVMRIVQEKESIVSYEKAFEEYMSGYTLEHNLEQKWIDRIDSFVQYRICDLYHWIKGRQKEGSLSDSQKIRTQDLLSWSANQMESKPLKLV